MVYLFETLQSVRPKNEMGSTYGARTTAMIMTQFTINDIAYIFFHCQLSQWIKEV